MQNHYQHTPHPIADDSYLKIIIDLIKAGQTPSDICRFREIGDICDTDRKY
jgi:hypothetical protein